MLKVKKLIIDTCCVSYSLLLLYGTSSKLIDYESFRVQLGQSPVISSFAGGVSFIIPAAEIAIAVLLFIKNCRIAALFAGYSLMCMFTAYIYIILNYSPYIPCSCGGVLENMDWTQHMIFNICFLLFAASSILLSADPKTSTAT